MKFYPSLFLLLFAGVLLFTSQPVQAASTITVTTTNDTVAADGACSLREAIQAANTNTTVNECVHDGSTGTDTINFSISTGLQTIVPTSALPFITASVIIDGTTQPGFGGCDVDTPKIELNGTSAGANVNGFVVTGNDVTIRGLVINRFDRDGIYMISDNNTVQCNIVGLDNTGTIDMGNTLTGITADAGSDNNLIGGTNAGDGNISSANNWDGILVRGDNNTVQGNIIGTDITGTIDLGNFYSGIGFHNTDNSLIGDNLISGNGDCGIWLGSDGTDGSDNNTIQGNIVGTDISGTVDIGNTNSGICIWQTSSDNQVGGTSAAARNLFSGNNDHGVEILNAGTTNNIIQGNYIGTDINGNAAIGNTFDGVAIYNAATNTLVGGTAAGAGNLISGNQRFGVDIVQAGTDNNTVQGNFIGTNATGTADLGNAFDGVIVRTTASSNTIGGTAAGAGNVISGNNRYGILIFEAGTNSNAIQGNFIGTDATGTADLGNTLDGIRITNASDTLVGGATASARNIISGNDHSGFWIDNATNTTIQGNYIGTDVTGTADLGNSWLGMAIENNSTNTQVIANLISGNDIIGILLRFTSSNSTIQGNLIGTNAAGTAAIPNPIGIDIRNSNNNTIGGATASAGNIISGNTNFGIILRRPDPAALPPTNNLIQSNFIGTNAAGQAAVPNAVGVQLQDSAADNTITQNLVSGNTNTAIVLEGLDTDGNTISANLIGSNLNGNTAIPNALGIHITQSAAANFVEANLLAFNTSHAIQLDATSLDTTIVRNRILNNTGSGIQLDGDATILLNRRNCIMGNNDGLVNTTLSQTTAQENWWGAADGPSDLGPGNGDTVSIRVNFSPWLQSAVLGCAEVASLTAPSMGTAAGVLPGIQKLGFQQDSTHVTWSITVSNTTGATASNLTVSDEIPAGWQIVSVNSTVGTVSINGQSITVSIPSLADGATAIVTVTTIIPEGTIAINTACLAANQCSTAQTIQSLPITGETPLWRTLLFLSLSLAAGLFIVVTSLQFKHKRQ